MTGAAVMAEKKRVDAAVKIDAEIARKVRTMCSFRGTVMAEYISAILKPVVDRDFEKFRKEIQHGDK